MVWSVFTAFFWAIAGLVFGSFLNVCITRLPRGESVVQPRSHCRQCGREVANRDNIPLLSWLLLGGRCRACSSRISWRYPLVEAATSLLFIACWFKFGATWRGAEWALFCFLLLGLAVMDAETMLLPDRFTLPGLALGVLLKERLGAAGVYGWPRSSGWLSSIAAGLLDAAIAAALLLLLMGAYWLVRRRRGMGMGDVKLLAMLAAWLGLPQTGLVLLLASVFGAAYGLSLIASKAATRRLAASQLAIPFGAFLSGAGLYSIFLGERTVRWYLQFFR